MHLNNVALRVMKKNLVPLLRERGSIIRKWDPMCIKMGLKCRYIICPKSYMTVFDRVDMAFVFCGNV